MVSTGKSQPESVAAGFVVLHIGLGTTFEGQRLLGLSMEDPDRLLGLSMEDPSIRHPGGGFCQLGAALVTWF